MRLKKKYKDADDEDKGSPHNKKAFCIAFPFTIDVIGWIIRIDIKWNQITHMCIFNTIGIEFITDSVRFSLVLIFENRTIQPVISIGVFKILNDLFLYLHTHSHDSLRITLRSFLHIDKTEYEEHKNNRNQNTKEIVVHKTQKQFILIVQNQAYAGRENPEEECEQNDRISLWTFPSKNSAA